MNRSCVCVIRGDNSCRFHQTGFTGHGMFDFANDGILTAGSMSADPSLIEVVKKESESLRYS